MSKLAEYRQLERHLAEQLKALEALKGDADLKKKLSLRLSCVISLRNTVTA